MESNHNEKPEKIQPRKILHQSGFNLSSGEEASIKMYYEKMEQALRINRQLLGGGSDPDATRIINAINNYGLQTDKTMVLYRKSGQHVGENPSSGDIYSASQKTIISTTDQEWMTDKWSADYKYKIIVPPGERYIAITNTDVSSGKNFLEVMLAPGKFYYHPDLSDDGRGNKLVVYSSKTNLSDQEVNQLFQDHKLTQSVSHKSGSHIYGHPILQEPTSRSHIYGDQSYLPSSPTDLSRLSQQVLQIKAEADAVLKLLDKSSGGKKEAELFDPKDFGIDQDPIWLSPKGPGKK